MSRPAIVVFALLLSACAARTPPAVQAAAPDALEQLRRDLNAIFTDSATGHAQWSVQVESLRTAETLYGLDARRLVIPGSSQKLIATAAAIERLGWDFRFTTRVLSTAPIDSTGTINGDLIVVGSGDPTINPRHPARWRAFDDWAQDLRARGLTIVSGRLIGDDRRVAEPGWGFGWSWDDLHLGFGAEPSALQYHENRVEVLVGPGIAPGSRAIISTAPFGSGLVIDHDVVTAAPGEPTSLRMSRAPRSAFLTVTGRIAVDAAPVTLDASVDNPTRFYVTALREALARHGIFVSGGAADIDDVRAPIEQPLHELIVDRSPPFDDIVDVTLKWSRNIYAESLVLALASPDEPASGARGMAEIRNVLRGWGIGPTSFIARDGSGLSRYNYVTAATMTQLLTHLWRDPKYATRYQATLPVSGRSGTLANRMRGTAAEARVLAKTGTMSHVRSLCGYVTTAAGEPLVFAILANDFLLPVTAIDALVDRALVRLAGFTR
jgi:serine-type D-Ala-D-Ala carboxypeptidase/endopeptidase (penicillin-binding protein 4)